MLFEKRKCVGADSNGFLGVITLNRPNAINSLNLEMCQAMADTLALWRHDPEIHCIFIHGSGDKGFCAGGDVKLVREAIEKSKTNLSDFEYVLNFFCQEYRNDYQLSLIEKPIICWASGITMGGGMGVMQGASYRIATETSVFAMPEISIGLYPDVGASYFLSKLPPGVGLFLGLTGARFGPHDAIELELADFYIKSTDKSNVLESLSTQKWTSDLGANHSLVTEVLINHKVPLRLRATVSSHIQSLALLDRATNLQEAFETLMSLSKTSPWVAESLEILKKGSPLSACIIFEYLNRAKALSRKEVFLQDFNLSIHFSKHNDFSEGVRAVLVAKDNKPKWQHSTFDSITKSEIESYFTDPWSNSKYNLITKSNPFLPIVDSL